MEPTAVRVDTGPVGLVRYDWGGPPGGAPVLLAHPTGFNGLVWAPVARRLVARGRRVWSFDFRGHGASDRAPDYHWRGFSEDTRAVVDSIGSGDLTGVGISKGGAALLMDSVDQPHAFARLWCYEPIVFPPGYVAPGARNPMADRARRRRARWSSPDDALRSYASRPPLDALHADALRGYVQAGLRRAGTGWELTCAPEDEAQMYEMGADNGVYELLGRVPVPVTVLAGEHTGTITPAWATLIAARIPAGRLEIWDGRGHFGPLEDPDRAARALDAVCGHP